MNRYTGVHLKMFFEDGTHLGLSEAHHGRQFPSLVLRQVHGSEEAAVEELQLLNGVRRAGLPTAAAGATPLQEARVLYRQ